MEKQALDLDLYRATWICDKAKNSKYYAQNVYAALCNEWQPKQVWAILKDQTWGCSWRHAGSIVAKMINSGDYLDFYCSGIQDFSRDEADPNFGPGLYVPEGTITEEIREDFALLGWVPAEQS